MPSKPKVSAAFSMSQHPTPSNPPQTFGPTQVCGTPPQRIAVAVDPPAQHSAMAETKRIAPKFLRNTLVKLEELCVEDPTTGWREPCQQRVDHFTEEFKLGKRRDHCRLWRQHLGERRMRQQETHRRWCVDSEGVACLPGVFFRRRA